MRNYRITHNYRKLRKVYAHTFGYYVKETFTLKSGKKIWRIPTVSCMRYQLLHKRGRNDED